MKRSAHSNPLCPQDEAHGELRDPTLRHLQQKQVGIHAEPGMTNYEPQKAVYVGRPPCAVCGAAYRLHIGLRCPTPYRPDTIDAARDELARAEASGDQSRIFVARGEVQRIEGRRA